MLRITLKFSSPTLVCAFLAIGSGYFISLLMTCLLSFIFLKIFIKSPQCIKYFIRIWLFSAKKKIMDACLPSRGCFSFNFSLILRPSFTLRHTCSKFSISLQNLPPLDPMEKASSRSLHIALHPHTAIELSIFQTIWDFYTTPLLFLFFLHNSVPEQNQALDF